MAKTGALLSILDVVQQRESCGVDYGGQEGG